MKYSGFRRDVKRHVLTFSSSGQRQVTTCCTCAVTSRKKCHVSACRRQAGDACCLRCLMTKKSQDMARYLCWIIYRKEVTILLNLNKELLSWIQNLKLLSTNYDYNKQQKTHRPHHHSQKPFYGDIKDQGRDHTWTSKRNANQINSNFCQTSTPPTFSGESY